MELYLEVEGFFPIHGPKKDKVKQKIEIISLKQQIAAL